MIVCGVISNIGAATISLKWSKTNYRASSYVASTMTLAAAIILFFLFSTNSFPIGLVLYGCLFLLTDGYLAPIIS